MVVAVVHPLRALRVVDKMIVDDVQQHGDAAPVAFAHEAHLLRGGDPREPRYRRMIRAGETRAVRISLLRSGQGCSGFMVIEDKLENWRLTFDA